MRLFLLPLIVTLASNCGGIESSWNCFGASSPVDLILINDEPTGKSLTLYQHSKQVGFDLIGTLKLDANSNKTICLETEGIIEEGLFVCYGDVTHKITLNWPENFQLEFSDTTYRIPTPGELKYPIDPK